MSSRSSDLGHSRAKIAKMDNDNDCGSIKCDDKVSNLDASEKIGTSDEKKADNQKDSDKGDKFLDNPGSPELPPISRKVDDESDEPVIPKLLGMYFSLLVTLTN